METPTSTTTVVPLAPVTPAVTAPTTSQVEAIPSLADARSGPVKAVDRKGKVGKKQRKRDGKGHVKEPATPAPKSSDASKGAPVPKGKEGKQEVPPTKPATAGKDEGAGRDTQILWFPFQINHAQMKYVELLYPSRKVMILRNAEPHPHPLSAWERQCVEDLIYGLIRKDGVIVDIGGSARRHHSQKRDNVWSCSPKLTPADYVRKAMQGTSDGPEQSKLRVCDHTAEACNCVSPDVYMSIHSLYYLSRSLILQLLQRATTHKLYAAHFTFPDPKARLYLGECWYERSASGIVDFHADGNSRPYQHESLQWLSDQYYEEGGFAMAFMSVRTFGHTTVTLFTLCDPKFEVERPVEQERESYMPYNRAILSADYIGEVDMREVFNIKGEVIEPLFEAVRTKGYRFFSLGTVLKVQLPHTSCFYCVPKHAIAKVASYMFGKPRTMSEWALCQSYSRQVLKQLNLTPSEVAALLPIIACLGFTHYLEAEQQAILTYIQPRLSEFDVYNKSLQFNFPHIVQWKWLCALIAAPAFTALVIRALHTQGREPKRQKTDATLSVLGKLWRLAGDAASWLLPKTLRGHMALGVALGFGFVALTRFVTARSDWRALIGRTDPTTRPTTFSTIVPTWHTAYKVTALAGHSWTNRLSPMIRLDANEFVEVLPGPIEFMDVCMDGRELSPIKASAKIWVNGDWVECKPGHGVTLHGIGVPGVVPLLSRVCVHNELVAVNNRGCRYTHSPDEELWHEVYRLLEEHRVLPREESLLEHGRLRPIPLERWLSRFTLARQKLFRKALDHLARGDPQKGYDLVKAFVKREHVMKLVFEHLEDYDPRLIQGKTPVYQVLTGPFTLAWSNYLKKIWGRWYAIKHDLPTKYPPITSASGLDANALGEWFQFALDEIPEGIYWETDASRHDTHVHKTAKKQELREYKRLRPAPRVWAALSTQMKTKGITTHGVWYIVDATMQSGVGNTTCGNTFLVCTGHYGAVLIVVVTRGDPMPKMFILGIGDDIITRAVRALLKYMPDVLEVLHDLGWTVKCQLYTHPFDAEFCSGRFYPSSRGWLFGPRIGRVIAKVFYAKDFYSSANGVKWAKSVALGLWRDTHHIPVLRAWIAVVLHLTQTVRAEPVVDEYKFHVREPADPVPDTWEMCHYLYGLTRGQLEQLEQAILRIPALPAFFNHPWLNHIIKFDLPLEPIKHSRVSNSLASLVDPTAWAAVVVFYRDCVFSPLFEETIRRKRWWVTPAIIGAEVMADMWISGDTWWKSLVYRAAFHGTCHLLPYRIAIAAHSFWNFMVCGGFWFRGKTVDGIIDQVVHWMKTRDWNRLMHATNGNPAPVWGPGQILTLTEERFLRGEILSGVLYWMPYEEPASEGDYSDEDRGETTVYYRYGHTVANRGAPNGLRYCVYEWDYQRPDHSGIDHVAYEMVFDGWTGAWIYWGPLEEAITALTEELEARFQATCSIEPTSHGPMLGWHTFMRHIKFFKP